VSGTISSSPATGLDAGAVVTTDASGVPPRGRRRWVAIGVVVALVAAGAVAAAAAGGTWFYLGGILEPDVLAPQIDSSVLVGYPAAEQYLGFDGNPSTIYLRAQTSQVTAVDNLLAAQANPENPGQVQVSQPSAALTAQADAQGAFNGLFLGLRSRC
jgi:hypothetical protein